jgi:hypothetical protein
MKYQFECERKQEVVFHPRQNQDHHYIGITESVLRNLAEKCHV